MQRKLLLCLSIFTLFSAAAEPIVLEAGIWDMSVKAKLMGLSEDISEPECLSDEHTALELDDITGLIKEHLQCGVTNLRQEPGKLALELDCPGTPFHQSAITGTHTPTQLNVSATSPMGSLDIVGLHSGKAC